jgi:hypothetical protein
MSNSRKKTPIIGMTSARSDKPYKRAEHSRQRSAVKVALSQGRELPSPRLFGDECSSEKDGKQYCPGRPEFLRK